MFSWIAIYKDGTTHPYNTDNFDIGHVDLDKLDKFQIKDLDSKIPLLQIHFDDPRKRLIYVRRVEKHGKLPKPFICHMVGWQMKVNGENIQNINYVFETIIVNTAQKTETHVHWIEQAGKYDRKRDSRFYEPSAEQLAIAGSKAN